MSHDSKRIYMPELDINDPTDLDILRGQFNMLSADEWEEYIVEAEARNLGYKNINILKSAQRKAGIAKYLSPKVLQWIMSLVDRLDYDEEEE